MKRVVFFARASKRKFILETSADCATFTIRTNINDWLEIWLTLKVDYDCEVDVAEFVLQVDEEEAERNGKNLRVFGHDRSHVQIATS